jgi:hypothetical protein
LLTKLVAKVFLEIRNSPVKIGIEGIVKITKEFKSCNRENPNDANQNKSLIIRTIH